MNILLIGSGGREHAISKKIKESKRLNKLFILPGNAGTFFEGENLEINSNDFYLIAEFALKNNIDLIVPCSEIQLVNGIVDYFSENIKYKHIKILGPTKLASMLESSKDFSKKLMQKYNIPTAKYATFTSETKNEAYKYLEKSEPPYVLKADGLASGKGVIIVDSLNEAKSSLDEMFSGKFGNSGKKVVIEEFLDGIEVSVFILTDGKSYILLPEAKDYKKIGEGDLGLNTGGMGAISPVKFADNEFMNKVKQRIIEPTLNALKSENILYKGFIFFGLISVEKEPIVIEYNVRPGDPESEVFFPRIESDLIDLFETTVDENLDKIIIKINPKTAATVMLVSGGYPNEFETGKQIFGIENITESTVMHAGTKLIDGKFYTNSGRVMSITSIADTMEDALKKSYKSAEMIKYEGKYYRNDIGFDL